jgi:hypothetical protein
MRHITSSSIATAVLTVGVVVLAASCASDASRTEGSTLASGANPTRTAPAVTTSTIAPTTSTSAPTTSESSADLAGLPRGATPFDLDPSDFTSEIDNPFWPMQPGTRWTYREIDSEGSELQAVIIVTTQTKLIAGITARVVRDTVTRDGEIVEDTFDWYAQDSAGNIWYLGEDTAEFEGGVVTTTAGSWQAGVNGALAGVVVAADPQPGLTYRQEYYAGEAEDNGEVLSLDEAADVPFGQFDMLMMTADTSALDPSLLEHKFYAKGVGPVLTIDIAGGGREELVSVDTAPNDAGTGPLGSPSP